MVAELLVNYFRHLTSPWNMTIQVHLTSCQLPLKAELILPLTPRVRVLAACMRPWGIRLVPRPY